MLAGILSALAPTAISAIGDIASDLFKSGTSGKIRSLGDFGRELLSSGSRALIGSSGQASPLLKGVKAAMMNAVNSKPVISTNSTHARTLFPEDINIRNETFSGMRARPKPAPVSMITEPVFLSTTGNVHGIPQNTTHIVEGAPPSRRRRRRRY